MVTHFEPREPLRGTRTRIAAEEWLGGVGRQSHGPSLWCLVSAPGREQINRQRRSLLLPWADDGGSASPAPPAAVEKWGVMRCKKWSCRGIKNEEQRGDDGGGRAGQVLRLLDLRLEGVHLHLLALHPHLHGRLVLHHGSLHFSGKTLGAGLFLCWLKLKLKTKIGRVRNILVLHASHRFGI